VGKQRHRRKIESLETRIREHREKISRENQKSAADAELIRHWEREIRAFERGIRQARKRLGISK
jgi:hypothetical protein